jgi:cell division protein FtsB
MKNKRIRMVVIGLSILAIACLIFALCFNLLKNFNNNKQISDLKANIENINKKNDELQQMNTKLQTENENLKKGINNDSNESCTFIKTLKIIDLYDYYANDNNQKFIIVEQFQSFDPFILKVDNNMASELKEDKYYEFTFRGNKKLSDIDGALSNFNIVDISYTDKIGLSQIQETCK